MYRFVLMNSSNNVYVQQWLKNARTCPVCRGRIESVPGESTASSSYRLSRGFPPVSIASPARRPLRRRGAPHDHAAGSHPSNLATVLSSASRAPGNIVGGSSTATSVSRTVAGASQVSSVETRRGGPNPAATNTTPGPSNLDTLPPDSNTPANGDSNRGESSRGNANNGQGVPRPDVEYRWLVEDSENPWE